MSTELDSLTAEGFEALRVGNEAAANAAFAKRDTLASEVYGNSPVPEVSADGEVVENLAGLNADAQPDTEDHGDLLSVFAQSVSGQHLGHDDIGRAEAAIAPWAAQNPSWDSEWRSWAEQSADRLAWVTDQAANGRLPAGPPSKYADELAEVDNRHAALREIQTLDPLNSDPAHQRRLQALYSLAYKESIVGRSGRTA